MERSAGLSLTLFWFRRDLRLDDHVGLFHALKHNPKVQPLFIFDTDILTDLQNPTDRRISFIYETIEKLKNQLVAVGSDLWIFYGKPLSIIKSLSEQHSINSIYVNGDYEPYARKRDDEIRLFCVAHKISFYSFKDQVIFEKDEVTKPDGNPYTVFTPFMNRWKQQYSKAPASLYSTEKYFQNLNKCNKPSHLISLKKMGFQKTEHGVLSPVISEETIKNYHLTRNQLGIQGTTRLSVHLRFGTISIRKLVRKAQELNETYLNELIWREFYMQILWHFPHVTTQSFKPKYDSIPWNTNESDFEKWCTAQTGYPIVDAAMNELLQTGFMHNRARMITASFLTRHLLIDWRKGEAFFAHHLTDYELSSNNGGWQWAAGSGCDAVPYFRIFNPSLQAKKFDSSGQYIRTWNVEKNLPMMIDHQKARERCLNTFKKVFNS